MKRILLYTIIITGLIFSMSACDDSILDKYPEDAMSDATFFTKAADFKTYVNGLYNNVLSNQNIVSSAENGTDNFLAEDPGSNEMQHSNSGAASETNGTWNNRYSYIRQVNYVLNSQDKLVELDDEAKQYIGEAYFIRAWHYFILLHDFGGVPYIDQVLGTESEELFKTRDSRDFVATKIIEDLDKAIDYLDWKNEGFATAPRINKQSALAFKTRVGLFEGSWEYYHGQKNTTFKVDGADGTNFLNAAVEAGEMLIAYQGTKIYKGRAGWEYYDLFNQQDYSGTKGVFLYKHMDYGLDVFGNHGAGGSSYGGGLTKSAVDNYLMADGKPESVSDVDYDYTQLANLIAARDPRMDQTLYSPARGNFADYAGQFIPVAPENQTKGPYQDITNSFTGRGGYKVFKGMRDHYVDKWGDNQDEIMIRYAEALLNYAEAKAMLGSITQTDIDKSVNVIRDRVGMTHLNMAEANAWSVTYSVAQGYDPAASNILNEIRRERRVELILENYRRTDLKRWAIYEDVVNGYKPVGAYYQEFEDFWNDDERVLAAGYAQSQLASLKLHLGQNVDVRGEYMNTLFKNADFTETGRGYYIDPNRDYLEAIPKKEIDFYEEKGGVTLEQNPGWF
ncbi:RagB/SusD family nutrient uptake outer membrane protein [Saccharicrinis sp. 156]|uniref:RagB/SusD family nutrient uptake outer membrane protein n=1 Tax=Saccharicrinis sp. 156 TaxID=3417574 RepID=UPI003D3494C7